MTTTETGLVTRATHTLAIPNYEEAIKSLQQRRDLVLRLMESTLKSGIHYGTIPGCGDKPSLFLTGAEQLSSAFNFCPRYKVTKARDGMHLTVDIVCELYTPSGDFVGEGVAMCSTYESKYRWRAQKTAELTDQPVPKKYWDLRKTDAKAAQALLGGPGYVAKKDENNTWMIFKVAATGEREENPDLADTWNTILKMGAKRAFVHAVRTATGTADIYTQDLEDFKDSYGAVLDAEIIVYPDVPGFDPTTAGAGIETKAQGSEPKPPAGETKSANPEKPATKAPVPQQQGDTRLAPEDRPDPKKNAKKAEEFAHGVSPETSAGAKPDRYGNPIPAIDSEAFPAYASLRLNNACGLWAAHYVKTYTGGTTEEKKERAIKDSKVERDLVIKKISKEDVYTGTESNDMKKVLIAEGLEKRFAELKLG